CRAEERSSCDRRTRLDRRGRASRRIRRWSRARQRRSNPRRIRDRICGRLPPEGCGKLPRRPSRRRKKPDQLCSSAFSCGCLDLTPAKVKIVVKSREDRAWANTGLVEKVLRASRSRSAGGLFSRKEQRVSVRSL